MATTVTNITRNENDPTARLKLILATNHPNEITALVNLKALAATQAHSQVQISLSQCSLSNLAILEKVGDFVGAGATVLIIDGRALTDWSAAYIQFIQPLVDRYGPNRLPILWILRKEQQEDFESGYHQQRYFNLREAGGISTDLLWLSRLLPMDFFYPNEQSGVLLTSKLAHLLQVQGWRTSREQTQRQQKQNERDLLARITQLEAASHDAIISVDPDYKINSWNKGAERIYGYSAAEVIGKSIGILGFPEEDLNPADRLLLAGNTNYEAVQNPNGSGSWSGVAIHRSKSGQKLYIESTVTAIKTPQGDLVELIGVNRNITVQKGYEQELIKKQSALVEANSYLKALINQSPTAIVIFDREGVCLDINEAAYGIFGIEDPSMLVGKYNILTDPFVAQNGNAELVRRAYNGEVATLTPRLYDFSEANQEHGIAQRKIILSGKFFPIFDNQGQVQNVVVMEDDITEQHVMANQLLQAQKMEIVSTLISTIAHDFKNLLAVSFIALDILKEEVRKLNSGLEDLPQFAQIETVNEQAREMLTQLLIFARIDKSTTFFDVTEKVEKNEQAVIVPEGVYLEDVVHTNVDLLKRIAGKNIDVNIKVTPITLDQLYPADNKSFTDELEIAALISQACSSTSTPPISRLLKTAAPATQISQVLMNFVVNACDAIAERASQEERGWLGKLEISTLTLSLEAPLVAGFQPVPVGSQLLRYIVIPQTAQNHKHSYKKLAGQTYKGLKVRDNGIGIEVNQLEHIFEPLYTTKEFGKGTGLGLASCYAIARNNGGWIEVESQIGVGSSFTLYLPIIVDEADTILSNEAEVVSDNTLPEPKWAEPFCINDEAAKECPHEALTS